MSDDLKASKQCIKVVNTANSRSGAAKGTVGKVGPGSLFADSWHSRRAKPTSDNERLDVMAELDRGGGVVDFVCQDGQLVVNQLLNRQPMQLLDNWLRW